MENLFLLSINGQPQQPTATFQTMYEDDFNFDQLTLQLLMLPDLLKTANKQHSLGIKKVTSICTLSDILNVCGFANTMFSEVHKLLHLYLTIPVTTATAERTFSTLRRLKNYLRTTMTEKRLNHLIIVHSHKQRTDDIDILTVAREFSQRNDRRSEFFGTF